ncbi:MAG: PPC domain-containing protein [Phormidesmis sp.]
MTSKGIHYLKSKLEGKLAKSPTQSRAVKAMLAALILAGVSGVATRSAFAQSLLQKTGNLAPMEDTYTFDGDEGQTMTIELESADFDTVLQLKGPNGELITTNDDYGVTLNSTIVIALPETGTYSAIATSYSGLGGSYQIEVRPTSEYEQVFNRAYELTLSEDYPNAVEAYSAAIALNDTDPSAYIGRAEAFLSNAYLEFTDETGDLNDLPDDVLSSVASDYNKAADLLDQQGQTGPAASLREQAQYFVRTETSTPTEQMIPVEPNGGIGDGAQPLPEVMPPEAPEAEPLLAPPGE